MTTPKKMPSKSKPRHPVSSAAQRYEALKAEFIRAGLSPREYEQACRRAARKAGL